MGKERGARRQPATDQVQGAIYKISDAAFFARSLEELYQNIHRIISELMEARNFYIALIDPVTGFLDAPYFVDEVDPPPGPGQLQGGLTEYVLRTGEPLLASPEVFEELERRGEVAPIGAPSIDWLGVPLVTAAGRLGVLVVQSYRGGTRYREEDKQLLIFVSHQIAMAIERKRAEEALAQKTEEQRALLTALRQQRDFLRTLSDNIPDLIWAKDMEGRYLFVNKAMCEVLLKCTPEEALGETDIFFAKRIRARGVRHDFGEMCLGTDQVIHETRKPGRFDEYGHIEGVFRWLEVHKAPFFDTMGAMIGTVGCGRDITDRRRAEEELRRSESTVRALLAAVPDLMFRLDREGRFLDTKREGVPAQNFYMPPEQFLGKSLGEVLPPDVAEKTMHALAEVFQTGQLAAFEYTLAFGGQTRCFEARVTPCGEAEALAIIREITDRRRMEQQLFQAQKMESIGAMAGGIAHDFNNILGVILGYASFMKMKLDDKHPFYGYVDSIERGAQRAADLTLQLLAFARGGRMDTRPVNLNAVVTETVQMVARTFDKRIEIRSRLSPGLPTVNADSSQVQQVLMNLFMNARDAMPEGGQLLVETMRETLSELDLRLKPEVRPGEYVVIAVSDTGIGMDKDTMMRAFEPFFTTKEKGKGTGLGLAMAYGVVQTHGGFIRVYSEVGHGTTFRVYLPMCGEPEPLAEIQEEKTHPLGTETLLVVDDEADIRDFIRDIFTEYGYKVITASNGFEAIELFRSRPGGIDLVILDLVMPKMDGQETFHRLRELDPNVRALVSSGYSQEGQAQKLLEEGVKGFLQKPYQVEVLLTTVRDALGPPKSR